MGLPGLALCSCPAKEQIPSSPSSPFQFPPIFCPGLWRKQAVSCLSQSSGLPRAGQETSRPAGAAPHWQLRLCWWGWQSSWRQRVTFSKPLSLPGSSQSLFQWAKAVQIRTNLDLVLDWLQGVGLGDIATEFFRKLSTLANLLCVPKTSLLQVNEPSWRLERKGTQLSGVRSFLQCQRVVCLYCYV